MATRQAAAVSRKTAKKTTARKSLPRTVAPPPVTGQAAIVVAPGDSVTVIVEQPKQKLVRDSFTMPKSEYDVLAVLKARLVRLERPTKKGELIRAGIAALAAMAESDLLVAVGRIPSLKTGRPKKAKGESKAARKAVG